MEKFQKLIQKAIQKKVSRLVLKSNTPINVAYKDRIETWNEEVFSYDIILSLFQGFFKKPVFEKEEYCEWPIPKFGNIYIIVEQDKEQVFLKFYFFDQGYQMFQQAWADIQNKTNQNNYFSKQDQIPISSGTEDNKVTSQSQDDVHLKPSIQDQTMHKAVVNGTNIFITSQDNIQSQTVPTKDTTSDNSSSANVVNLHSNANIFQESSSSVEVQSSDDNKPEAKLDVLNSKNTSTSDIFAAPIVESSSNSSDIELKPNLHILTTNEQLNQSDKELKNLETKQIEDNDVSQASDTNMNPIFNNMDKQSGVVNLNKDNKYISSNINERYLKNESNILSFDVLPYEKLSSQQRLIDSILSLMVQNKASDMHIKIGSKILLRIDESLIPVNSDIVSVKMMEDYFLPILDDINKAALIKDNHTYFCYQVDQIGRFRIKLFRDYSGIGAVIRYIPLVIPTFESLSLPSVLSTYCQYSSGLIVVSGPSRGGKTTTLAAMINWINSNRNSKIITIENPIEYIHKDKQSIISQKDIKKHCLTFEDAMRDVFTEDADVLMISDLHDYKIIDIALELAETGHLVLAVVNATSVINAIDRLIDKFPKDKQEHARLKIADTLQVVITQVLVKKQSGGLLPALELLRINLGISAIIKEGKTHMIANQIQSGKATGNILLNEYLIELIKANQITVQEAYMKSLNKKEFKDSLNAHNIELKL